MINNNFFNILRLFFIEVYTPFLNQRLLLSSDCRRDSFLSGACLSISITDFTK